MRSAEVRRKFLKRLAASERESINYFDVEREFFLIDSDNLPNVQPRFYGYSIQADGIYEEDNLSAEAVKNLDGRGCYVCVDVRDGQITIKQDLNGCWGIYLFRHGDYFALSNSFFRLVDHVKFRYPLTINRDYCNYLMMNTLTSHAYSDTAVNEIELVERHILFRIDTAKKHLQLEPIDYKEHSLSIDSAEGIATLDSWVELWGKVFRGVPKHTKIFESDLSGGFDSRISFLLLLNSGIDLNQIRIVSLNDNVRNHKEDFAIASKIANHYGFKLNQPLPESQSLNYSLFDSLNIDLYHRQPFKKRPDCPAQKTVDKKYHINGYGGETIRKYWHVSPSEYLKAETGARIRRYSDALFRELFSSIKNILETGFRAARAKHKIADPNSEEVVHYLYQETRCRSHFGKNTLSKYFKNTILFSPLIDPKLRMLQLNVPECPDTNLLMAVIFTRYRPELLKFPFEGENSIAPETVAFAQKISERFPPARKIVKRTKEDDNFNLQPRDKSAERILATGRNNKPIPANLPRACLKAAFDSSKTYGLFTSCFDADLYNYAAAFYEKGKASRDRYFYSIYGIAKVLEDIEISRRNHPPYCDVKRFIEEDVAQVHVPDAV